MCSLRTYAQQNIVTLSEAMAIKLPVLHITTSNGEEPTFNVVYPPSGAFGKSITNNDKVPGRLVITLLNDTLYDSGDFEKDVSGMTIRVTGNTSAANVSDYFPYKIKLEKKADLLFRKDSSLADREWRLLHEFFDLRSKIGLRTSELMGMEWTPSFAFCNVFLNGRYLAPYMLIESVKQASHRVNIIKNKGCLIERDGYWWNEDYYFSTSFFTSSRHYRWTIKHPDIESFCPEMEQSVKQQLTDIEQALECGTEPYQHLLDVESWAKWLLVHDMVGTNDSGGANLFLSRYDDAEETPFKMGPMWDFDSAFKQAENEYSRIHGSSTSFYFQLLFKHQDKAFQQMYRRLWYSCGRAAMEQLIEELRTYAGTVEGKALQQSRLLVGRLHGTQYSRISSEANAKVSYLTNHLEWLESKISKIPVLEDIEQCRVDCQTSVCYDLWGIPRPASSSKENCFYIQNNQKILIK